MYRKTVDYGNFQNVQTVEFDSFRRKGDLCSEIIIENEELLEFKIKKGHNTLITILVMAHFLIDKKEKKEDKFFASFCIDYVPKLFYNYQHEDTLEQLLAVIKEKTKTLNSMVDHLSNNMIVEFVIQCYARKTILDFIQNNPAENWKCLGNETELISDYNAELRGNLLDFLASALKLSVTIKYKDTSNHGEEIFTEILGDISSKNKVEIWVDCEYHKVSFSLGDQPKLGSTQSSQNVHAQKRNEHSTLEVPFQIPKNPESRSINKDNQRCQKCRSKLCSCESSKIKGIAPRTNTSNIQITNRIFEGIHNSYQRQTSNRELVKK